jgi:hypothetical protein
VVRPRGRNEGHVITSAGSALLEQLDPPHPGR